MPHQDLIAMSALVVLCLSLLASPALAANPGPALEDVLEGHYEDDGEAGGLLETRPYLESAQLTLPAGIGGMVGATAAVVPAIFLTVQGAVYDDSQLLFAGTMLGAAASIPMLSLGLTGMHTSRLLLDADVGGGTFDVRRKLAYHRWVDGDVLHNIGLATAVGGGLTPLMFLVIGLRDADVSALTIGLFSLPAAGIAVAIGVPLAIAGRLLKDPVERQLAPAPGVTMVPVPWLDR